VKVAFQGVRGAYSEAALLRHFGPSAEAVGFPFSEQVFDAVEADRIEVLADERSRFIKASLSHDHELIYPPVQEFWDAAVKGTG